MYSYFNATHIYLDSLSPPSVCLSSPTDTLCTFKIRLKLSLFIRHIVRDGMLNLTPSLDILQYA